MSSGGQALGGIVGGVIGFFVGGPVGALRGAQLGIMAGGLIDPPKGPTINGPRLEDLNVQTSTYGAFIPRNYGTVAQSGNVFWIQGDAITEVQTTTTSGGKGGPQQTTNTWSYYATFAVGLCKGPIDGVRRIWIGGQLWYDAGSDDLGSIISSNQSADLFTLYLGTDTQTADPLIQADKGEANVPAHRGLAYIVFDSLPLEKYGNSLMGAQVKVEVVQISSVLPPRLISSTEVINYPLQYYPRPFHAESDGVITFYALNPFGGSTTVEGEIVMNDEVLVSVDFMGTYIGAASTDGVEVLRPQISSSGSTTVKLQNFDEDIVWWPEYSGTYQIQNGTVQVIPWGAISGRDTLGASGARGDIADALTGESGRYVMGISINPAGDRILVITGPSPRTGTSWTANRYFVLDDSLAIVKSGTINSSQTLLWNISDATSDNPNGGTVFDSDNYTGWTVKADSSYLIVHYYYVDDSDVMQVTSPVISQFITDLSYPAVAFSDGILYVFVRTSTAATLYRFTAFATITESTTTLGDIVEAECLNSKLLAAGDLDVTELTDAVRGYRVSSLGPLRGGIDPLRKAWPFDVVQRGYQIKFKTRGGSSVATITEAELDAREAGASPGVQVTNIREMDTILPDQLTTKYLDAAREYDINVAEQTR